MDPTDSERAHITYWQLQKACFKFMLVYCKPINKTFTDCFTSLWSDNKNGKKHWKKNSNKTITNKAKKPPKNKHTVFLLLAVLIQHLINTLRHWRHSCGKKHFCVLYLNNGKALQKSQPLAFDSSDFVVYDLSDVIPRFFYQEYLQM